MNRFFLSSRFRWLNLPGALLVTLLQRTPVVRVLAAAESVLVGSPVANVLRSAVAVAAATGTMHTLVGATPLVPSSGSASGLSTSVGAAVDIFFTVSGTQTRPLSWTISGSIPPGLSFSGLTAAGTVNVQDLRLSGAPTTAGTYTTNIIAWEGLNASLTPSPTYSYTITVTGSSTAGPSITAQPQSQAVAVGANATFSVTATGSPTPSYQWQKDGVNVGATNASGATTSTLTITSAQIANAGTYSVIVTNSGGTVTSNPATLAVGSTPVFGASPSPQSVLVGDTVTLSATATGAPTPTYQWQLNGVALTNGGRFSGVTTSTLTVTGVALADAGTYTLTATNSGGSASTTGLVTVNPVPVSATAAWLTNLAVRTTFVSGQGPLTVGLSVNGGTKNILVRGAGPGLGALLNLSSGYLPDPRLDLYSGQTLIDSNDTWNGALATLFASLGAYSWPAGSKDAAAVWALKGGYTVQIPANGTGLFLLEAYDTDDNSNSPRLTNISARNRVGTGDDVLVAGFNIKGSGTKKLLIRAVGPSLSKFSVSNPLSDPKLEVYTSARVKIAENDTWDPSLATVFTSVGAFDLNAGSKDAAMVVPLAAGAGYTVQVKGADGGTGEAVVEVYELP